MDRHEDTSILLQRQRQGMMDRHEDTSILLQRQRAGYDGQDMMDRV